MRVNEKILRVDDFPWNIIYFHIYFTLSFFPHEDKTFAVYNMRESSNLYQCTDKSTQIRVNTEEQQNLRVNEKILRVDDFPWNIIYFHIYFTLSFFPHEDKTFAVYNMRESSNLYQCTDKSTQIRVNTEKRLSSIISL